MDTLPRGVPERGFDMGNRNVQLVGVGVIALCLIATTNCRRSGEADRAGSESTAPWTLTLAAPIDHLDMVAREPMIVEHPDGTLFVGGFGASYIGEKRTDPPTLWKSRDRGATWIRVDVGPEAPTGEETISGNSDMDLAVAPDGTVYFVTLIFDGDKWEGKQVSIGVSRDLGETWKWTLLSKTKFDDRPWVKVAPDGTAHVIWNDGAGVCHAVSQDCGRTWTERERIHPQGGSSHLAVGPNGEVAVRVTPASASYNKFDEGVDLVAVSADGGMTWRKHTAPGTREWVRPPNYRDSIPRWVEPLAWDERGALYSFWTSLKETWLARSLDHGATWTTWRLAEGSEVAYFPYLVARGSGELAATWFSGRPEVLQAHAARIDVSEGEAPPRMVEAPPFRPDSWRGGPSDRPRRRRRAQDRRPDNRSQDPPVRETAGEYFPILFLRDGGLAVVSPIQNWRENRFGFSFWKVEERRGGSRQKTEGQSQQVHPLLGHGLGVDHVGIAVRDLIKTRDDYERVLGFKFMEIPPQPDGFVPYFISFENTTYLELQPIGALPFIAKMFDYADGYADFAEKYEGAVFLGLAISSAKDAADHLKARSFQASLVGEDPGLNYVMISHEPSGEKRAFPLAIFLVEYISSERVAWLAGMREKGMMVHPNTARRLFSVWFAVRDLEASLKNIQDAGFEPGETREAKFLGAKGREVKAGNGYMLLLQSIDKNGVLAKFLSDRHDGEIIGVSVEVSDVEKARSLIESRSGQKLEPYDGFYGRSIMIPPDMAHGVWLEMFQR